MCAGILPGAATPLHYQQECRSLGIMHTPVRLVQARESPVKLLQPRMRQSASVCKTRAHDHTNRCCACRCRHPVSAYSEASSRPMPSRQGMPGAGRLSDKGTSVRCQSHLSHIVCVQKSGRRPADQITMAAVGKHGHASENNAM